MYKKFLLILLLSSNFSAQLNAQDPRFNPLLSGTWTFVKAKFYDRSLSFSDLLKSGFLQIAPASGPDGLLYKISTFDQNGPTSKPSPIYFGKNLAVTRQSFCYNPVTPCLLVEYLDDQKVKLGTGMKWRHGDFTIQIKNVNEETLEFEFLMPGSKDIVGRFIYSKI